MKDSKASLRRRIRLAPGHRLDRPAGGGPVLSTPKGPVQLNESAAAVLDLCDGTHRREEIVARRLRVKDEALANDLRSFLDAARRRGWIVEE